MRAQIALLKNKLDKEEILNRKIISKSMKRKLTQLNRQATIQIIAGCFVIFFFICTQKYVDFSTPFVLATCLMLLISILATIYTHRGLWNVNVFDMDLIAISVKLQRLRKIYARWTYFSMPVVLLWLVWLEWEAFSSFNDISIAFGTGGIIGGVIGIILGKFYKFHAN